MTTRTARRRMYRSLPAVTVVLGLITTVSAALHTVSVIGVAYRDRDGYDARLAALLWIGWTSLVCGVLMIASARGISRNSPTAHRTAVGASAVFLVSTVLIAVVDPSFWTSVPLYGGYIAFAAWLRPVAERPASHPEAAARPTSTR